MTCVPWAGTAGVLLQRAVARVLEVGTAGVLQHAVACALWEALTMRAVGGHGRRAAAYAVACVR